MASTGDDSMTSYLMGWVRSKLLEVPEKEEIEQKEKKKTWVRPFQIILVIGYVIAVIVWFVVVERGYQRFEAPIGSTIIKLKGTGLAVSNNVGYPQGLVGNSEETESIWDPAEYSIPPMENNAFFIMTRSLITFNQTQDTCSTSLSDRLFCDETNTTVCHNDMGVNDRGGFLTGKCVASAEDGDKKVCEIKAWCPVESSKSLDYRLDRGSMKNFTAFIKTVVSFSNAGVTVRTVKDEKFDPSCRFNASDKVNKKCPIFSLGYMIDNLQVSDKSLNQTELFEKGGLILIEQTWDCNVDTQRLRNACFPNHVFRLLQGADDSASPGINYRFATKYFINGKEYRKLTKVYGIRFILVITGRGGRFNIVALSTTIQGNLALIGVIAFGCALILKFGYTFKEQKESLGKGIRSVLRIGGCKSCYDNRYRRQNDENHTVKASKDDPQVYDNDENAESNKKEQKPNTKASRHHKNRNENIHMIDIDSSPYKEAKSIGEEKQEISFQF